MNQPLPEARPPEGFTQTARWVLDSAIELSRLRGELAVELTGGPGDDRAALGTVPEKMVLVASELATNALRHGLPPTTVTLLRNGDEWMLDVADQDPSATPVIAAGREAGEGGHGLRLTEVLSAEMGWYATVEAKHVWACFPAGPARPPEGNRSHATGAHQGTARLRGGSGLRAGHG